jgi:hypothetical protein
MARFGDQLESLHRVANCRNSGVRGLTKCLGWRACDLPTSQPPPRPLPKLNPPVGLHVRRRKAWPAADGHRPQLRRWPTVQVREVEQAAPVGRLGLERHRGKLGGWPTRSNRSRRRLRIGSAFAASDSALGSTRSFPTTRGGVPTAARGETRRQKASRRYLRATAVLRMRIGSTAAAKPLPASSDFRGRGCRLAGRGRR